MSKKKARKKYYGEPEKTKTDEVGQLFLLAFAAGYVMCRRPAGVPFVLSVREWDAIGKPEEERKHFQVVKDLTA